MKISKVRGSKIPASGLKNKKALNINEQFVAQLKENSSADELGPISEVASVGAVGAKREGAGVCVHAREE